MKGGKEEDGGSLFFFLRDTTSRLCSQASYCKNNRWHRGPVPSIDQVAFVTHEHWDGKKKLEMLVCITGIDLKRCLGYFRCCAFVFCSVAWAFLQLRQEEGDCNCMVVDLAGLWLLSTDDTLHYSYYSTTIKNWKTLTSILLLSLVIIL
jgi:hypothetical protein